MLDVRAPMEFRRGAFPTATNIPLLNDSQRQAVGRRYRQAGQEAAVTLGHDLLAGEAKAQRLHQWTAFLAASPQAALYCFRGGLRSELVQQWLRQTGLTVQRVAGGYKALRRFLIDQLELSARENSFIVVAGKTGCAKTHLLHKLPASIDLEGRANHRGSAFGKRTGGQPTQIDFENWLAVDFLKLKQTNSRLVFIEDESRAIGSLSVPLTLLEAMRSAPLAVIEEPLELRADTILNDYIIANFEDLKSLQGDNAFASFSDYLLTSLNKIQRRLGPERYRQIHQFMTVALERQAQTGDTFQHRAWIESLLRNYYDPMYEYQLNKKLSRIAFRGSRQEFICWAQTLETGAQKTYK